MLTQEQISYVERRFDEGANPEEVAAELGMHHVTLRRYANVAQRHIKADKPRYRLVSLPDTTRQQPTGG